MAFSKDASLCMHQTQKLVSECDVCVHTHTQRACKGSASSTVISTHQPYNHQEYFSQPLKFHYRVFCTSRVFPGLAGMGTPMSKTTTKLTFQYFPSCPILVVSANNDTWNHGHLCKAQLWRSTFEVLGWTDLSLSTLRS